jgi:hypothetical protein
MRHQRKILPTPLLQVPIPLKSSGQQQYDQDDQDNPDNAYTSVPKAIPVTTEAAAEAAQQKDNENNNEYESDRH